MSALNTLIDGYYTLKAGDKKHRVRSIIDGQLQADFARWNFEQAAEELSAARKLYTEAEFEAERAKLRDEFRKGLFSFKSKRGVEALTSLPGLTFVCSRLIEDVDEFTVLSVLVKGADEAKELLKQILTDSFPELTPAQKNEPTQRTSSVSKRSLKRK